MIGSLTKLVNHTCITVLTAWLISASLLSCTQEEISDMGAEEELELEQEVDEFETPILLSASPSIFEIELKWESFEGAIGYELDVAKDIDFTSILANYNARRLQNTTYTVSNLESSTEYHLRIRAVIQRDSVTENSNTMTITTLEYEPCEDPVNLIILESEGVIRAEFENGDFGQGWLLNETDPQASGNGYMVWTKLDYFSAPSNDLTTFNIQISNPGTYHFLWKSAYTIGELGTEHNDTWLRFPDAADYYAQKPSGVKVYPKGVGKTPNPEGASHDGWFKVYRSGNDKGFKWQARTYDRDPHQIYATFDTPGKYTMEVSARSNGHGIDQFVLYLNSLDQSEATTANFSEVKCTIPD